MAKLKKSKVKKIALKAASKVAKKKKVDKVAKKVTSKLKAEGFKKVSKAKKFANKVAKKAV